MNLKKEVPSLALIALPLLYLALVWHKMGEKIPLHWNIQGEVDRFGSKYTLLVITTLLPFTIYFLFKLIQRFGPKEKLEKMGRKFNSLKFILMLFTSVMMLFIIHSSIQGAVAKPTFIFVLIGLLFATLGNYFRTLQPNYFIGIRTPWTLRNEAVWKSTHELGGKLWFVGGLLIALLSLISISQTSIIINIVILSVITLIPIVHSFIHYRKLKKN